MVKRIQAFALTTAIVFGTAGSVMAQTPAPSSGSTVGGSPATSTAVRTNDRDDHSNWGWVGLLGLVGLGGLMGNRRTPGVTHTTGTTGTTGSRL